MDGWPPQHPIGIDGETRPRDRTRHARALMIHALFVPHKVGLVFLKRLCSVPNQRRFVLRFPLNAVGFLLVDAASYLCPSCFVSIVSASPVIMNGIPLQPPQEASDIFSISDQVLADRLQFIEEVWRV